MMQDDPTIKAIRDARHRISEMVDHDPRKLVQYYRQRQERHRERLVEGSEHALMLLTEEQRKVLECGQAMRASLDGCDVVLVRTAVYKNIQTVLEAEKALIEAGHTRGFVQAPEPLEALPISIEQRTVLGDVTMLPGSRFEEIQSLIRDYQHRAAWVDAVSAAQGSLSGENSC
jgi:hypothetical protein